MPTPGDDSHITAGRPPRPAGLAQALVPTGADIPSLALRMTVAVLITLLLLFVAWLAWQGVKILLEIFAGVLFALFLQALSEGLQKMLYVEDTLGDKNVEVVGETRSERPLATGLERQAG